jgi:hypothetical protein
MSTPPTLAGRIKAALKTQAVAAGLELVELQESMCVQFQKYTELAEADDTPSTIASRIMQSIATKRATTEGPHRLMLGFLSTIAGERTTIRCYYRLFDKNMKTAEDAELTEPLSLKV